MKEITLTETQYHTLLQALNELHELEIEMQCNDCEEDDKFYKLSKKERREAMTHEEPFNTTATEYLLDILQAQPNSPSTSAASTTKRESKSATHRSKNP